MEDKIRLLAWGDYSCATGFGQAMSNIMMELQKTGKYELDIVGINYSADPYDHERWPGRVWPAINPLQNQGPHSDPYGRQRVLDRLATDQYDILFMIQDIFIVQPLYPGILDAHRKLQRNFKTILYYPVDSPPKPEWIKEVAAQVDFPVTYTNYGRAETLKVDPSLKDRLKVIYHGTNSQDFHHLPDRQAVAEFRNNYFHGATDGRFLVMNVNRNQSRKDITRNFMVLAELRRRGVNDVIFYLHMQQDDFGGNILAMADNFGLQTEKDFIYPSPESFQAHQGIPISQLNMLYNSADAVFTTTLGEGWGLSLTESMATRTPVIAPDNTSITEILADGRGIMVPCGTTPSMWITKELDNERLRPLMDVEAAADAIEHLMDGRITPNLDNAQEFTQKHSWTNITKLWMSIIDNAAELTRAATGSSSPTTPDTAVTSPGNPRCEPRRRTRSIRHSFTVISINERRTDNRKYITDLLGPSIDEISAIEFIDGKNAERTARALERRNYLRLNTWRPSKGELGIWLSQLNCWEFAAQSEEYDDLIVFEDDAIVQPNFLEMLDKYIEEVPPGFDFIALAVPPNQYQHLNLSVYYDSFGDPRYCDRHDSRKYDFECGSEILSRVYQGYCLVATVITRRGAQRLLKLAEQHGFYTPVDCFIFLESHRGNLAGYAPKPDFATAVTIDFDAPSTRDAERFYLDEKSS